MSASFKCWLPRLGQRPIYPFKVNKDSRQAEGLVAWWPFGVESWSNVRDLFNIGYDGTLNGSAVVQSDEVMGSCINFPSGGYVEIPAGTQWGQQAANSGTSIAKVIQISFWFRTSAATGTNMMLVGLHSSSSSNGGFIIFLNTDGSMNFSGKNSSGATTFNINTTAAVSFMDGLWHHVFAAMDFRNTGTCTLTIDGILKGTSVVSGDWFFLNNVIRFGKSLDTFWANFVGQMVDARWFMTDNSGSLTAEIFKFYQPQTRWDMYSSLVPLKSLGKLIYVPMDGLNLRADLVGI